MDRAKRLLSARSLTRDDEVETRERRIPDSHSRLERVDTLASFLIKFVVCLSVRVWIWISHRHMLAQTSDWLGRYRSSNEGIISIHSLLIVSYETDAVQPNQHIGGQESSITNLSTELSDLSDLAGTIQGWSARCRWSVFRPLSPDLTRREVA